MDPTLKTGGMMTEIEGETATKETLSGAEKAYLGVEDGDKKSDWFSTLLSAETGPGPVEAYDQHVLNVTGTRWNARLARALTGWFGTLNLAILDAIMAGVEAFTGRSAAPAPPKGAGPNGFTG